MLNFCKQPEHHILLRLHLISGLCPGVINIKKLSTNKKCNALAGLGTGDRT